MKARSFPAFGSETQYAEPAWYRGTPTPYYNDAHVRWRAHVRQWVDQELIPHVAQWEADGGIPHKELVAKCVKAGIYASAFSPSIGGTAPEGSDTFMRLITGDELARCGAGGVTTALLAGISIGIGPVIAGGSTELKQRLVADLLQGRKFICLAITEPTAGSDVSGVRCTAKLDASGQFYVVRGQKKFISGAAYADFFTTAVQTESGVSLLLVEKSDKVKVRRLATQGWKASETGFIDFDDALVPVGNLLGQGAYAHT